MSSRDVSTLMLLLLTVSSGCGEGGRSDGAARVPVVATTTQTADLVRNVGGDRAKVTEMLRPNADPHDYEPRPSDAEALSDARAIFRSGGDLDAWLGEVAVGAGGDAPVVALIDHVETREAASDRTAEQRPDGAPGTVEGQHAGGESRGTEGAQSDLLHWWHDPRNAELAVEAIRDALVRVDPAGRAHYERNARSYRNRLDRLDRQVARCLARVPAAQRKIVTTHDALGPFADRYDVEVVGSVLGSLSTDAQPSAGDTQELIDQIREEHVPAIFAESSVDSRLEQAIARETGARVGPPLYTDALGPAGSPGATYIGSVAANADALVRGVSGRRGCSIDAAG